MSKDKDNNGRFFVLADIHGQFDNLMKVMDLITKEAGFEPSKDELVSLGDKCDRGPQTFEVFDYFKKLQDLHPDNVHMIMGNHELMMVDYAQHKDDLFIYNGGHRTIDSYGRATGVYGKGHFMRALHAADHWNFIKNHLLFLETEDYFFCHAPIPLEHYRDLPSGVDFRNDTHTLTWSYVDGVPTEKWVDPNPVLDKLAVYGHIHGITFKNGTVNVPGIRMYGNAILLDTGSGCAEEGYLSCLELPSMTVYTSRGEKYSLFGGNE